MSIEKLQRVVRRIEEKYQNRNAPYSEWEKAIFYEVGTSYDCVRRSFSVMKKLGWIKLSKGKGLVKLLRTI